MDRQAIAVFGEALVDDFGSVQVVGGAPFNVARHLAGFGLQPLMITRIGNDANGALVRGEFERYRMDGMGLQTGEGEATGRVAVEMAADGSHRFDILPHQAYDAIDAQRAAQAVAQAQPDVLYFGTLVQREETSRAALLAVQKAAGALRYLDLNLRDGQYTERTVFDSLSQADILKVNEDELAQLFDWYSHMCPPLDDMASLDVRMACAQLMSNFTLQGMIVTLGARGAVHFSVDGGMTAADGVVVEQLADTVGAGDAFSSIYLLGRARGWPLDTTLQRASAFAGAVCGLAGAVPSNLSFYADWRRRWQPD
ncbi:carbohydrate kinase [Pseudoduganella ginsengisoli]|uniref:Fructokinase n=1 Tax=Pseudoduganella ginsengisoli TaxID=1462440 RepID=A0A6L6PV25_9BURK|nr:PfkB family carbohydrate kinase [Pseudoduganella ginsengisoli]MTW01305.1 fructokinase [Pseudoduganella ginsengisoli]